MPRQPEGGLDYPRLVRRAEQMIHRKQGRRTVSVALTDQALGRTDLAGKAATALAPLANKALATPGSRARKAMEKVTGIASQRVLPPYAKTRFSTWWTKRTALRAPAEEKQGSARLFPTCLVQYQSPQVGQDPVRGMERNGID